MEGPETGLNQPAEVRGRVVPEAQDVWQSLSLRLGSCSVRWM